MNAPTILRAALPMRCWRPVSKTAVNNLLNGSNTSRSLTSMAQRRTSQLSTSKSYNQTYKKPALQSQICLRLQQSRSNSTTSAIRAATDTSNTTSATPAAPGSAASQLPWNRFLALRKQRRRISLIASILGGLVGLVGGTYVVTTQDVEAKLTQMIALDPIVIMGISTLSFVGLGWLLGPFLGNAVFNARYRGIRSLIAAREREFYMRIKKYRVDPSQSSISNPPPDYYGEKIGSVGDYRRWLKDQRAFNLKRGKQLI